MLQTIKLVKSLSSSILIFNFALSNIEAEKNFWVTDLRKKSGFALLNETDIKREVNENQYNMRKISYRKTKTEVFDKKLNLKTERDHHRHQNNPKLKR